MSHHHHSPPESNLVLFTRRRRVYIACSNCRRRKIRCITNEESPEMPCERCARRGFTCEYRAVCEGDVPSPSQVSGRDRAGATPVQLAAPTGYAPSAWNQSSGMYGVHSSPAAGPSPYASTQHSHHHSNTLPSGPQQFVPQDYRDRSSRPQHPAVVQHPPGMAFQPSAPQAPRYPTTRPPPPPPQQQSSYTFPGYPFRPEPTWSKCYVRPEHVYLALHMSTWSMCLRRNSDEQCWAINSFTPSLANEDV
ncbi:hypothetical protein DFH09DRAFT_1283651 [Mycena vulgaris]|nr:hypothetical protein DFH09DRAFT_1283651 [Mycena vulgaris]